MSAFIVSHAHIDALLDFALRADRSFAVGADELTKEGRMLMEANIASVCHRYREPVEAYALEADYHFMFPRGEKRIDEVQALKACECFDYQSCEVEGYYRSKAATLIDCIRKLAISRLPGYQAAQWEIRSETRVA